MRMIILAIFVIALSTLALFSGTDVITMLNGSHSMNSLTSSTNDIECAGCHQTMRNQLDNSSIHSNFDCEECHRLARTAGGKVIRYATHNQSGITIGNESHAAYTPRCLDCHGGNGVYYNDSWVQRQAPTAIAFNESGYGSDYSAHKPFVEKSTNWGLSKGENEACIACHTNYSVVIKYKYFWDVSYTKSGSSWTLTNFNPNGTREYSIQYSKAGAKHEFVNSSEITCLNCHDNIYEALVNGTSATPHDYLTHAPIEIDTSSGDHEWEVQNYWGHTRYHYIPPSYRSEWVNSTYCIKCHNVDKYASQSDDSSTYSLSSVIGDTNSTSVHAAEALRCTTCHGPGKTKDAYDALSANNDYGGDWGEQDEHRDFMNQTDNKAHTFNGDLCMGCHEAGGHDAVESGQCNMCHGDEGWARCGSCHSDGVYSIDIAIESEPSGNVSRTTY